MPDLKKIKFVCPECGTTEIGIIRKEIIYIPIVDEVDISEEIDVGDLESDKESIVASEVEGIECGDCGLLIVSNEDPDVDPGEALIDWLEEKGMLEDIG